MMKSDIEADIESLAREHRGYRDGGYALTDAIQEYVEDLPSDMRPTALEVLWDCVATARDELDGPALECLVRLSPSGIEDHLHALLTDTPQQMAEREYFLLSALLRLGGGRYREFCVDRVRRAVRDRTPHDSSLVAALVYVDRDAFIEIGSLYLIDTLHNKSPDMTVDTVIGKFLSRIASSEPSLLTDLLANLRSRDSSCGREFIGLARSYLANANSEWARVYLGGQDVVQDLLRILR